MASALNAQPGLTAPIAGALPAGAWPHPQPRLFDYVALQSLLLLGYAILGKYFAYIGIGDFYVGEIVLAVGTYAFVVSPNRWWFLKSRRLLPLIALMTWGLIRTAPYVSDYGADALRDAVIWGYGWFAILIATLIASQPHAVSRLLDNYAWFARIFLVVSPVVWLLSTVFGVITLEIHGQTVPILKGGDMMVHLAGAIAFIYLKIRRVSTLWILLTPLVFFVGSHTRGGLLSLCVAVTMLFVMRPRTTKLAVVTAVFLTALTAAVALDVRLKAPGARREMSVESAMLGMQSVFSDTGAAQYDGTKRWRLEWWNKIAGYTLHGPYFWHGKGFGPNIAFSDGIVTSSQAPLRSPHNGQLTFLARAGVPGFVLWLVAQGAWLVGMVRRWWRCARAGPESLSSVFLFLIAYWLAFITNTTFDVFLEGPMGGIWFWTLYGTGLGTIMVYDATVRTGRLEHRTSQRPA